MTTASNPPVAIVTGGNRGIGRSTAMQLADAGVDVILTFRTNEAEADAVVASINESGRTAVAVQLDTSIVSGFDAFAETVRGQLEDRWERTSFDFLVNNAGSMEVVPFEDVTEETFDAMVDVHYKGVFFLTQRLLPLITDGGAIVNVSSGLTRFTNEGTTAYASAKGAVEVLTRGLAKELGNRRIKVNTLAPGAIATDLAGGFVRDNQEVNEHIASITALGRVGEPDDIGGAITALLTSGSGWITGQRIEASGGTNL